MMIRDDELQYVAEHYEQLIGFKVESIAFSEDEDEGDPWPVLVMTKGKKKIHVEVACDPEGNGCGHLFIEAQL